MSKGFKLNTINNLAQLIHTAKTR